MDGDVRRLIERDLKLERIELSAEMTQFVTERHLASLTIVTPKGRPHVTPVGFTWDEERQLVRVITWAGSTKAKILDKAETPLRAAVSQVDGGRWVTLEGSAVVTADKERCHEGHRETSKDGVLPMQILPRMAM